MITLLYAALCTLLVLGLAIRVMLARGRLKVGLGDGGHGELNRRVRAHSNAVEYVPLALILLGGMELNGYPDWLVHVFGATLVIARALHAWGLAVSEGRSTGRFWGTLLTLLLMVAMCVMAIVGFAAGYSAY
ncbi:MAPEG family protein [uncultured Arenimonas sp.]|uniref:MAPEG family protein n=1 Tax=uncultured Arenimonas sp. TaxID=546226 RepID=UPI0030DBD643